MSGRGRILAVGLLVTSVAQAAAAQVTIEYIAHASFVIESPDGQRVLLDPYNGHRWLGYGFPEDVAANAVLITHPHYDHDAAYYVDGHAPVFRRPGRYRVGDIEITGVAGKHADPYGMDFEQINTLWVLDTGGLRIAHLGDNGPLTDADLEALGRVDVLLVPVDGQYHILSAAAIRDIEEALRPRILVPMHYQIPSLSSLPESLGPIDPWLRDQPRVSRLDSNRVVLSPDRLPDDTTAYVFRPADAVRSWTPALHSTLEAVDRVRSDDGPASDAVSRLRQVTDATPGVIQAWLALAEALTAEGRADEAIAGLERGLASAGRDDAQFTLQARRSLARLYRQAGRVAEAALQYRLVLAASARPELRQEAEAFLEHTPY